MRMVYFLVFKQTVKVSGVFGGQLKKNVAAMTDSTKNDGAPVFVEKTPTEKSGSCFASTDPVHPQMYNNCPIIAKLQPLVSGKYRVLFSRTSVIGLGIALIVCGVLSHIGASIAFRFYAGLSQVGTGIWCGYAFQVAGALALFTAHYGTKRLILLTAVAAGSAVIASIVQLAIVAAGLGFDLYTYRYDFMYYYHKNSAVGGNATMITAAILALLAGLWLLAVASIAVLGRQTSFQVVSAQNQFISSASQPNIYESFGNEQMQFTNVQSVYQQQQPLMTLNYPYPNITNVPMAPQVLQMPVASLPLQTTTTSTIPNQQVLQLPVQLILNALQHHFNEEMRNQQMLSIPTQFVAQLQQPISFNNPPANTIGPVISSQLLETPKNDDRDVEKV